MDARKVTMAELAPRIARFAELRANPQMFVDTRLPEYERELWSIIGPGVAEDPDNPVAISEAEDFNLAYVRAEPGKGAALHAHPTVEVFIPLTGRWAFYWNEGDDREEVVLDPLDCVSFPAGVMRGFYNAGEESAMLIGIVGGAAATKVTWSEPVLARAAATGLHLDADGNLIVDQAAE